VTLEGARAVAPTAKAALERLANLTVLLKKI